jgi:hypothetical protein
VRARVRLRYQDGGFRPPHERAMLFEGNLLSMSHQNLEGRRVIYLSLSGDSKLRLYEPRTVWLLGDEIRWQGLEQIDQRWVFQEWDCRILSVPKLRV